MHTTSPFPNRRDLLSQLIAGIAAGTIATIDTGVGSAQSASPKGPLTEKLLASKYLPAAYSKAAESLLEFDNLTAAGKPSARDALARAAAAICDGLSRLADDAQFWAILGEQRKPIGQNETEIKRLLSNLDEFVPEEEKALGVYLAPGPTTRLTSGLTLAISRFRGEPNSWTLEDLRSRVSDSRDAVCGAAKPPANEPRGNFFSNIRLTGYSLGVLGGAASIAINAVTSMALPLALTSVVSGVATIIGSSAAVAAEVQSRRR